MYIAAMMRLRLAALRLIIPLSPEPDRIFETIARARSARVVQQYVGKSRRPQDDLMGPGPRTRPGSPSHVFAFH